MDRNLGAWRRRVNRSVFNTVLDHVEGQGSALETEFKSLVTQSNLDIDNMSLDDLRDVVANYLQDVMLELKNATDNNPEMFFETEAETSIRK